MKTFLINTLIAALFVVSCKTDKQNNTNTPQEQSNTTTPMNPNQESLKSKLDAKKEASKLKTDPTTAKVFKEGGELAQMHSIFVVSQNLESLPQTRI